MRLVPRKRMIRRPKRRNQLLLLAILATIFGAGCGDDDVSGSTVSNTNDGRYGYSVGEVRHQNDVYLCINNTSTGGMWCENIGLGGNG